MSIPYRAPHFSLVLRNLGIALPSVELIASMYACIDLGSNSFHLLIAEMENGKIKILERCSEKVQLGEAVSATGLISKAAFDRGLKCLKTFSELMAEYPIERYWALGTNTFRVTANASEFVEAAKLTGIDIAIITGVQEAVLIYAGVITKLPLNDDHRLVIDIGGGSTEVIVGSGQNRLLTDSLAIGSVAWRDQFFANKTADEWSSQMDLGLEHGIAAFGVNAIAVKRAGWAEAYASSGTVKMLSSICQFAGGEPDKISCEQLVALKPAFLDCIINKSDLPGLKERRRDLLLGSWCIMVALMRSYGVAEINFSSTALREGMLDFIVKNKKTLETMQNSDLPAISHSKC